MRRSVIAAVFMLGLAAGTGAEETVSIQVEGFVDFYYGTETGRTERDRRPELFFNHTRLDDPALNLALLRIRGERSRVRGQLGLMAGSYAAENLAAEPDWLQPVFEAHVGFALDEGRRTWLDLGVLPSHIGFESAISADNPTLSRSLAAENSPYYLTGARFGWSDDSAWSVAALVVTGWQRSKPVQGSSIPSFGTQVTYAPTDALTVNWSTFVGTDDPDERRRWRYFNNLYARYAVTERLTVTAGIDLGYQQRAEDSSRHDSWSASTAIARYAFSERWAVAVRLEHYRDPDAVIATSPTGRGVSSVGYSFNLDHTASERILVRIEVRALEDRDRIFADQPELRREENRTILASLALRF